MSGRLSAWHAASASTPIAHTHISHRPSRIGAQNFEPRRSVPLSLWLFDISWLRSTRSTESVDALDIQTKPWWARPRRHKAHPAATMSAARKAVNDELSRRQERLRPAVALARCIIQTPRIDKSISISGARILVAASWTLATQLMLQH
jgi:hypothetical protein